FPGTVNPVHLRLLVDDDGNFSNATAYSTGLTISYSNPLITVSGITTAMIPANSTRYITIGTTSGGTPLPIELLSFESVVCNQNVCNTWQTATEKNNELFEVERTANGEDWRVIGKVPGAINSFVTKHYECIDKEPLSGLSYYRLKQIDLNGDFSYSPVSSVNNIRTEGLIKMFPNPANAEVVISGANAEVKVINALGADLSKEIQTVHLLNGDLQLKTSSLINGIYYVQIFRGTGSPVKVFKLFIRH
nr:T9SS type A sorting domain-containing protein [Parachlamydiaceae bacterium]